MSTVTIQGVPDAVDRDTVLKALGDWGFNPATVRELHITADAITVQVNVFDGDGLPFIGRPRDTENWMTHSIVVPLTPVVKP